ncbi:glycoside hydrolase [Kitasatospora sp. NPDC090091]|uniref:glycoside hydrolase n=1 Tax=Kitasatospora sp. NPDC090091 TaxID=3364081 RepID=UPI00382D1937
MERRTLLRGLVGAPIGAMALFSGTGRAWAADPAVIRRPERSWGVWEGWGTSLGWWANNLGPREDLADLFFTRNTVPFGGRQLPGLGLNIVRYDAGASGTNVVEGRRMQRTDREPGSPLDGFKEIEGFQLDWYSADPYSSSFDWTADANQRGMLKLAKDRGADTFELFANSPMWWMLKNDDPRGAYDGLCNLQDGNFDRHAAYLATVARYAHDHWGIDFASVQPVNEPGLLWGAGYPGAGRSQEGCHYSFAQQAELIRLTRAHLDVRGLQSVMVAALDENTVDAATATWTDPAFDAATRAAAGRINVHGYDYLGGDRAALHDAVSPDKKIWLSEYGDEYAHGLALTQNLHADLRRLHPTAWINWQILDWGGWGAVNFEQGVIGEVLPKYYVLAHYTRHIRPGMEIIDGGSENVVAAYDAAERKLVIVAVNYGDTQWLDFDLSRLAQPGRSDALVHRWVTGVGPTGERYQHYEDTYLHGARFWSEVGATTVNTFEVSDVDL